MNRIADQLRRLRSDRGVRPLARVAAASLTRVDRLRSLLHRRERRHLIAPCPLEGDEIADGVRCVRTEMAYAAPSDIHMPPYTGSIDRTRLLCFDTETTGLSGGIGARAFMIGVAEWRSQTLVVRQLYLTKTGGERAMLETFVSWLQSDTVLVSYNGKSYDAPLLKGRLRLNCIAHPLAELQHVDWLHPTRRRYRGVLPNCKLSTIERDVLRILREDDLPGAQAPAAWLTFLRGQSAGPLSRVLAHNRQDVITLARLGDHHAELLHPRE